MRRLITLFLLAVLLPTLLAAALVGAFLLRQERASVERQAVDLAQISGVIVSRELAADRRAAQMIAQSPALDGNVDEARFRVLGLRFLADEPLWRVVSVSDRQGHRLVDVPKPIGGRAGGMVVELASHQRTVETGLPQIGLLAKGPGGKAAFAVRAPATRTGKVRYVVSVVVDPHGLSQLLALARPPAGWSVRVVDRSGGIVADTRNPNAAGLPLDPKVFAAAQGSLTNDGIVQVADLAIVARPVSGAPWMVVACLPSGAYSAPLARAFWILGIGALGALLVTAFLARLARREFNAQHEQLTRELAVQRLEALGRMTGGVAHDFNNLLTPILAGLDLLAGRLKDDPRNGRLAEAALGSAERARVLVQRLLSFARRQDLEPTNVDLAVLLADFKPLVEQTIGNGVEVLVEVRGEDLFVRTDPAQLELAILNLAVNARDAMPTGGQVTIIVDRGRARAGGGLKAGPYVRVSVVDNGFGMDEDTLKRATEPFFTTKPIGQGTGLGLSMAYGLAAQSGGALTLKSAVGEGTTVRLWFPPAEAPDAPRQEAPAPVGQNGAKVLLVDDDPVVLTTTTASLEDKGFAVTACRSADAALAILRAGRADVLVTDLTMPDKDGAQLAWEAREVFADLPILVLTGFARPDLHLPAAVEILEKPYRPDDLAVRISQLWMAAGRERDGSPTHP